jgi:RNA polymerase sigma factor for flagellar operon FliA
VATAAVPIRQHTTAVGERYAPLEGDREAVLRRHLPLVRRVVQRLASRKPPHIDVDDLMSWGIVGLLDAIDKYDPTKEALFSTYAQFRIRGAVLDHLRSLDWIPRSVRQKAAVIEKATRELEALHGRPASEEEIAAHLGLTLGEYQALLSKVGEMALFSVDDFGGASSDVRFVNRDEADADPAHALLHHERVRLLAEAVRRLPEREQTVIALYYQEDLTMKEVGQVLGLTESRVSQIHSQAVLRLKGHVRLGLGSPGDGDEDLE